MADTNIVYPPHKSSVGDMDANLVAVLTYVGAIVVSWIPYLRYIAPLVPLVFFFLETRSKLVKFHAAQSAILYALSTVVTIAFGIFGTILKAIGVRVPFFAAIGVFFAGFLVYGILLLFSVLGFVALFKAYKYEQFMIPVLGTFADKLAAFLDKNYPNMITVLPPQQPPSQPPRDTPPPPAQ